MTRCGAKVLPRSLPRILMSRQGTHERFHLCLPVRPTCSITLNRGWSMSHGALTLYSSFQQSRGCLPLGSSHPPVHQYAKKPQQARELQDTALAHACRPFPSSYWSEKGRELSQHDNCWWNVLKGAIWATFQLTFWPAASIFVFCPVTSPISWAWGSTLGLVIFFFFWYFF